MTGHRFALWMDVQELLAVSGDRLDVVDLRTKNPAHTCHQCLTERLQLLPTPDSSMLLKLGHGPGGWALVVLSLDESADPPLFRVIKQGRPLPEMASLPQV